jgi:hypothetical protein
VIEVILIFIGKKEQDLEKAPNVRGISLFLGLRASNKSVLLALSRFFLDLTRAIGLKCSLYLLK